MKTHARVVVIGGGIAGCSTLYHLTDEGWSDVVLLERDELTSGSTWHAAAQVTQFGANQTMVALKRHSITLYRALAADEAFPIDYHITGGMRLAHTQDQVDTYEHFTDMAKGVGVDFETISAEEAGRRHPLLRTDGLLGAWWDPLDGDIDPSQLTFALARKARERGAEVYRQNPVQDISTKPSGEFVVHTKDGDITCEMVVNAAGYRVNEVGNMLGVTHPVVSMEHMYFLTEPLPELRALTARVPIIRDPGDDFYTRQEKFGLLVGVYEHGCKTFGLDGIPADFSKALCPSDLDRCLDNMERIFERLPCLTRTGIHTVINGPITYSADGAPLVGPIPGVRNAFACIGLRAGIGEGGGHGKVLAQIMVHGECEWDAWFLDPRRFSAYANVAYTAQKAIEDYQREFHYLLPHEHRPAARLARTTPLYTVLDDLGATWGTVNGWERALFFKPQRDFVDQPGYRFTPTKEVVANEVRALTQSLGLSEVSGFNRYSLEGPGAHALLDRLVCGAIPSEIGEIKLCYLLTEKGNVLSEATVAKLAQERYLFCSAAAAEWHDRDWILRHADSQSVRLRELARSHTTLVLAGPKSRELLESVAEHSNWSAQHLPPMRAQQATIAHTEVTVMRVSYSAELSFEIHIPNEQLLACWQTLYQAGIPLGLSLFGLYAIESMRIERGYRHWKADLLYEFNPMESGLERFVDLQKPAFIGKSALEQQLTRGLRKRFVTLLVDCDSSPAHAGAPVYQDARHVGSVTSAGFGHRVQKNIALAFVDPTCADIGTMLAIGILGERYPCVVSQRALWTQTAA